MIVYSILLAASLLSVLALYRLVRGRDAEVRDTRDLASHAVPLDLEAFQNLLDAADDAFLRRNIPPLQYEVIRRMRVRAALAYLETVAANTAIVLRLAESMRTSAAEAIPEPGQAVVNEALRLRALCLLAILRLRWDFFFPGGWGKVATLLSDYRRLSLGITEMVRAREPALAAQALQALQA